MQTTHEPAFASRIVYYAARSFAHQLSEGDGYDLLRPTISICFLDHELFDGLEWRSRFVLLEATRHEALSDDLDFHFFELPKFDKSADEVSDALERWLYFLRYAEKMDTENVPAKLRTPTILRALKELEMVSQDELARVRYEEQLDSKRTYEFNLRMSRQEGEMIGQQKGEIIGQQKGEKIGTIRMLELFVGKPQSSVDELSRRSLEELDSLASDLERQYRDAPR
jgi:predicted transposase/invertase (TIGR01784 family)